MVVCREGPFDAREVSYRTPLPSSLMLLHKLHYHEYVREGATLTYRWAGCVGRLPVPTDLDNEQEQG